MDSLSRFWPNDIDERFQVNGELTIRGVTRSVTLDINELSDPADDPWGNRRIGLFASAKINRKDFGIVWDTASDTGGVLVGDEVTIALHVQFVKE